MYETWSVGIGVDERHKDLDFSALAGKFDFVDIRIGAPVNRELRFIDNRVLADMVQRIYDAGLIIGVSLDFWAGYWLHNNITMQGVDSMPDDRHPFVSRLLPLLRDKAVSWLTYNVYEDMVSTGAGKVTDSWLPFALMDTIDRINRVQRNDSRVRAFPQGIYSRQNFVLPAYPSLDTVLGSRPDVYLAIPKWMSDSKVYTVSDLAAWRPNATPPTTFGWSQERENRGMLWSFWEVGQRALFGVPHTVRYILFSGEREKLIHQFNPKMKQQPTPQPPVEEPPTDNQPPVDNSQPILDDVMAELATIRITVERLAQHLGVRL